MGYLLLKTIVNAFQNPVSRFTGAVATAEQF